MALGAGEVAEAAHIDERDVARPSAARPAPPRRPPSRPPCAANSPCRRCRVRSRIDEAVAGQDRAEMDRRACAGRRRRRPAAAPAPSLAPPRAGAPPAAPPRHSPASSRRPGDGRLPGWMVRKPSSSVHAVVVLGVAGADHDVADAQRRIEAARHAAQHQRAAVEAIEQQRRGDAGIDLARARFDEYRLAAGDLAAPEGQPADFVRLARAGRRDGRTPRAGPI